MKKFLCLLMTAAMLFSLAACDTEAVIEGLENLADIDLPELPQVTEEAVPVTEAPVEETPAVTEIPAAEPVSPPARVTVSIRKTTLSHYAPDDASQLILSFDYDTPIVSIEGRDDAAHMINDFTAYVEEEHYTGMEGEEFTGYGYYGMLEQAEDNYSYVHNSGAELPIEFSSSREVAVLRADNSVLSLVYSDYIFTGGENGVSLEKAYVFNTENGQRLSFDDLSDDSEALRSFVSEFVAAQAQTDPVLSTLTVELPFSGILKENNWYLSGTGLVIVSDYADFGLEQQGKLSFTVPYAELNGKIDPKWMPVFIDGPCSFSLAAQPAAGTEIYDMVSVDADGQEFYLIVNGVANQLKIASVVYADSFYETAEHWYASHVSDCAIQISAVIPEGIPELMISCVDAEGVAHNMLVTQSGVDGALMLADDNIQAVG